MKKLLSLVQLLPAVAVGLAAAIGFQLSAPALEAIVWPEEPDLSAVAEDSEALDEQETEAVAEELLAQGIGDFEDGVYYGSGTGFSGITQVEVVVENRQIVQINILSYQDDDTFFNRARGVIDAVLTAQTWEVDTISGATYSSRGILEAVKNALSGTNELSETADTGTTATELSVSSYDDSAVWADGTYTGSARGFGGIIKVQVTIRDGKITSIQVLSHSGETASYFNKAKAIISRILKAQSPNVDTVSGATYSSTGIREAVKAALKKAAGQASSASSADEDETVGTGTTAVELSVTSYDDSAVWADGTYTGSARGFGGNIKVQVTIKSGKITSIQVLSHSGETASYFNKAKAIISRILKAQSPNVDTVSGATYSSTGIREAVKAALKKAAGQASSASSADEDEDVEDAAEQTVSAASQKVTLPEGAPADGSYTGTGECAKFGYSVTLTAVFQNGELTALKDFALVDNDDADNEPFAASAWKGMKTNLLSGSTDVVSGATYSSNAILAAYQDAYAQAVAAGGGTVETPGESDDSDETQNSDTDEDEAQDEQDETEETGSGSDLTGVPVDGTYTASALCEPDEYEDFEAYTLTADVTFADGKLVSIDNLTSTDDSNVKYYTRAAQGTSKYTGVVAQLIDKQSGADIDAVSTATCSSVALVALYENAYAQAVAAGGGTVETPGESDDSDEAQNSDTDEDEEQDEQGETEDTDNGGEEDEKDEQDETEETGSSSDLTGVPANGTYTASALCEPDEYEDFEAYTLTADVTFADGKLVSIDNLTSTDDSNVKYYTRAAQGTSKYTGVVAQLIDKQSGADIDAVSNATCSSVALVALYENAYAQAVAANTGEAEAEKPELEEEEEPEETSEEEPAEEEASSEDGEAAEAESTDESTAEQEAEQTEPAEQETVTAASAEEQAAEEQATEEQATEEQAEEEETEEPASGDEQETEPASEETPQQNEQEDGLE